MQNMSHREGPLLHDFTHYFDLMDLYAGEVEWLSGMAEQRSRPWAVEDFSAAMLKFKNGVTGLICGAELTQYSDHAFELRGTTGLIRMLRKRCASPSRRSRCPSPIAVSSGAV